MDFKNLCGWAGPDIARKEGKVFEKTLSMFSISGEPHDKWRRGRRMLYEFTRKVLGTDTQNYRQQIGDCTSFSAKNVMEYLQCVRIILEGQNEIFHSVFPPYFYGCSRVYVGNNQIRGDGSVGVWTQEAAKRYGVLASVTPGCPVYSGKIARAWGRSGPDQLFLETAKKRLVKTTAKITSKEDAAAAIYNGYPLTVCSAQGFTQLPSNDGFHYPQGVWEHAMSIIGYQDHPQKGLYFIILNSWGDVHGRLRDFDDQTLLPVGTLRVHGDVVDSMLKYEGGDSFVYSAFDGFPGNGTTIDKNMFDLIGD